MASGRVQAEWGHGGDGKRERGKERETKKPGASQEGKRPRDCIAKMAEVI